MVIFLADGSQYLEDEAFLQISQSHHVACRGKEENLEK